MYYCKGARYNSKYEDRDERFCGVLESEFLEKKIEAVNIEVG